MVPVPGFQTNPLIVTRTCDHSAGEIGIHFFLTVFRQAWIQYILLMKSIGRYSLNWSWEEPVSRRKKPEGIKQPKPGSTSSGRSRRGEMVQTCSNDVGRQREVLQIAGYKSLWCVELTEGKESTIRQSWQERWASWDSESHLISFNYWAAWCCMRCSRLFKQFKRPSEKYQRCLQWCLQHFRIFQDNFRITSDYDRDDHMIPHFLLGSLHLIPWHLAHDPAQVWLGAVQRLNRPRCDMGRTRWKAGCTCWMFSSAMFETVAGILVVGCCWQSPEVSENDVISWQHSGQDRQENPETKYKPHVQLETRRQSIKLKTYRYI